MRHATSPWLFVDKQFTLTFHLICEGTAQRKAEHRSPAEFAGIERELQGLGKQIRGEGRKMMTFRMPRVCALRLPPFY